MQADRSDSRRHARVRPGSALAIAVALLAFAATSASAFGAAKAPIAVRVVVVTTWEFEPGGRDITGELHAWRTRWPLETQMPFPTGVHPLLYDARRHVLAILTGVATARAAASIMALGLDPRFDLTDAYWVVAGTAGVDPKAASIGSAAWARFVVDGDLGQEIDARDMPPDWLTGILPNGRTTPYELPAPAARNEDGNVAYALNRGLVDWAYARTRDIKLLDTASLARVRAAYAGPGAAPPLVLEGDGLMSARFWYGDHLNQWAERWVPYWTGGQGVFAMSAEEDTGIMQALTLLARAGRAKLDRVLILRAGSDYTVGPPGMTAADFLAKEAHGALPANREALDALYTVASPIVRALADDWVHTRATPPGSQPGPPHRPTGG